jgi:hypothetical protein
MAEEWVAARTALRVGIAPEVSRLAGSRQAASRPGLALASSLLVLALATA